LSNYFKNILYVKLNFESVGDNFEAVGFSFSKINAVFIKISWFFAKISKNNNSIAFKLSPIDSKLNFTYKMFLKVIDLTKNRDF